MYGRTFEIAFSFQMTREYERFLVQILRYTTCKPILYCISRMGFESLFNMWIRLLGKARCDSLHRSQSEEVQLAIRGRYCTESHNPPYSLIRPGHTERKVTPHFMGGIRNNKKIRLGNISRSFT
jgi:hypothetical protein